MALRCQACGAKCGKTNDTKRPFLAKFPLDPDRCREWVRMVGVEDLAYLPIEKLHMLKCVCKNHFKPKDFTNRRQTRLKRTAVPSLNLTYPPLSDEILKDFPLYIVNDEDADNDTFFEPYLGLLEKEHNYCCREQYIDDRNENKTSDPLASVIQGVELEAVIVSKNSEKDPCTFEVQKIENCTSLLIDNCRTVPPTPIETASIRNENNKLTEPVLIAPTGQLPPPPSANCKQVKKIKKQIKEIKQKPPLRKVLKRKINKLEENKVVKKKVKKLDDSNKNIEAPLLDNLRQPDDENQTHKDPDTFTMQKDENNMTFIIDDYGMSPTPSDSSIKNDYEEVTETVTIQPTIQSTSAALFRQVRELKKQMKGIRSENRVFKKKMYQIERNKVVKKKISIVKDKNKVIEDKNNDIEDKNKDKNEDTEVSLFESLLQSDVKKQKRKDKPNTLNIQTGEKNIPLLIDDSRTVSPTPSDSASVRRDDEEVTEPIDIATTTSTKSEAQSKYELRLKNKIKEIKLKNKDLQNKILELEDKTDVIETPIFNSLIQAGVKNLKRKANGKRWSELNKSVALAIYAKSPKSYNYLSELLPMPSVRTLQITLENVKMEPGIDPIIMQQLKATAEQLTDKERHCAIMFDEMTLKKQLSYNPAMDQIDGFEDLGNSGGRFERIADRALVFMLQGIHKKIKQAVSFYFVKGSISANNLGLIIETVITSINEIGFKVVATVCHQGPTFVSGLNLLKGRNDLTPDHNYFFINNERICIIFDVPHLFKSIRNNFYQNGIMIISGRVAQWSHLVRMEEKNSTTLKFTKFTKHHVSPKFKSKMSVKIAAQLLSNTTAAILKLMAESLESIEESVALLQTAEVVEVLDQLFDCTNGPASKQDIKPNTRANVSKNSFHHEIWQKFENVLKTVSFPKANKYEKLKTIQCITGYLITLKSLQDIWYYVASIGLKVLNLRQLNQDALEHLFSIIKQHSFNKNPTCHQFKLALKSAILTKLNTPSKEQNCVEKDKNETIINFHDFVFSNKSKNAERRNKITHSTFVNDNVLNIENPNIGEAVQQLHDITVFFKHLENQSTVPVSAYLAYTILKGSRCLECRNALTVIAPSEHSVYNYSILLDGWWPDKQSYTYPTIELCETVDVANSVFEQVVVPSLHRQNLFAFTQAVLLLSCNFGWICPDHKDVMVGGLIKRLSLLFIRNKCKTMSKSL